MPAVRGYDIPDVGGGRAFRTILRFLFSLAFRVAAVPVIPLIANALLCFRIEVKICFLVTFFFLVDDDARRGPTPISFSAPKKLTVAGFFFLLLRTVTFADAFLSDFFFDFVGRPVVGSARIASSGSGP